MASWILQIIANLGIPDAPPAAGRKPPAALGILSRLDAGWRAFEIQGTR